MQNRIPKALATLALSAAIALPTLCHTAQAAPRRGGGGGKTTGTTTGTANRPTPTSGARDVKMLEAALGRTLTEAEIAAITAVATAQKTAIDAANTAFQTALTSAFGLDSSQTVTVTQGCHKGGDVLSALATALGRGTRIDHRRSRSSQRPASDARCGDECGPRQLQNRRGRCCRAFGR